MTGISLAEYNPAAPRQQLHALLKAPKKFAEELRGRLLQACPGLTISHDHDQELLLATFPEAGDRALWLRILVDVLDVYSGLPAGRSPELLETRLVAVPEATAAEPPFSRHFRLGFTPTDVLPGEPTLFLEYGTSFGSGRHPSTRLAMAALDRLVDKAEITPARVLDVGCGSGILALACGLLGAREVLGVDIDGGALAVAARNAAANRLDDRVRFSGQTLAELAGPFDLLVANVTGAVMGGMVADFVRLTRPGGRLVVSGLQGRQLEEMAAVLAGLGFSVVEEFAELPWRAGLLRFGGD